MRAEFMEISSTPDHEPVVVPEPEPTIAPPITIEDATEQLTKEEVIPDSTVVEKEQEVVADIVPAAEPVHTEPVSEPEIIAEPILDPVPEPAPEPAIVPVEPPKAVPEEVLLPIAAPEIEEAAAPPPASCE